jgi:hypothetical protein
VRLLLPEAFLKQPLASIAIKGNEIAVVFRDGYQVSGQPIRRGKKEGKRTARKRTLK